MKVRAFFLFLLSAALLSIAIAAIPTRSVFAKLCYDQQHPNGYPCPDKKPTVTDPPPTETATLIPTDTPQACVPLTGQDSGQAPTQGNASFLFSPWILGGGGILIGLLIGGFGGFALGKGTPGGGDDGVVVQGGLNPSTSGREGVVVQGGLKPSTGGDDGVVVQGGLNPSTGGREGVVVQGGLHNTPSDTPSGLSGGEAEHKPH